jgi:alpha-galactosidase/6-phospho-beta-glucosidase family protein
MSERVTIVGGGSAQWVPILVDDIVIAPCLAGSELVLHDVDAARVERTGEYAEHVAGLAGTGVAVRTTTDLDDGLTDARFVVVCISTGGLDSMARDLDFSARFGLPLPIGDTVGPAGISRALRNVPVLVDLARAMEQRCPDAWMLNVTNPLTALTRAVTRETAIKAVGLCHEVQNCRFFLSQMLDANYADIELRVTGVNHLPLIVGIEVDGRDRFADLVDVAHERVELATPLPLLDRVFAGPVVTTGGGVTEAMRAPGWTKRRLRESQLLNYEVLKHFGAFPAAGVDHTVEFVPGFLTAESEWGKQWGVEPVTVTDRRGREATYAARLAEKLTATEPPRHRSTEMVVDVIEALLTGAPIHLPLNVPNAGQCPDLPPDVVVESICTVDSNGIRGRDRAVAPPALAALLRRVSAAQELTVDAAVSGSRDALLAALFTDPLASALDHARLVELAGAIVDATAPWLPQFAATSS